MKDQEQNYISYLEFGKERARIFPATIDYRNMLERILRVRGFSHVTWGIQEDSWMEDDLGFSVYMLLKGRSGEPDQKRLIFMANRMMDAEDVTNAMRVVQGDVTLSIEQIMSPD